MNITRAIKQAKGDERIKPTTPGQGARLERSDFVDVFGEMAPISLEDPRDQENGISARGVLDPIV